MPHVVYLGAYLLCPWPGCGYRIELLDFQLELSNDPTLYAQAIARWGEADFGLVGRCPGCREFVLFSPKEKRTIESPASCGLPVLPDDWHMHAYIA